jgi:hypothetical protein
MNRARRSVSLRGYQRAGRASGLPFRLLCMCLGLIPAAPGAGQTAVVVEPVQGLLFETLGPGGDHIPVRDASRRAEWLVRGEGSVELHLVLPEALESLQGRGDIALEFAGGDLAYILPGSQDLVLAHPGQPLSLSLPGNDLPVRVILGGTARSTGFELAGDYEAPVVLLVSTSGPTS